MPFIESFPIKFVKLQMIVIIFIFKKSLFYPYYAITRLTGYRLLIHYFLASVFFSKRTSKCSKSPYHLSLHSRNLSDIEAMPRHSQMVSFSILFSRMRPRLQLIIIISISCRICWFFLLCMEYSRGITT